jgi:hypothetical protein
LIAVMGVACMGGLFTMQKMIGPVLEEGREPPTDKELTRFLGEPDASVEAQARFVAAARGLFDEQVRVADRFHGYQVGFGLALASLYSLAFVFGLRAFNRGPGVARPLSTVSLLVLPARVAVAAVDIASARALGPAARSVAEAYAQVQPPQLPVDQVKLVTDAVSDVAPWMVLGVQVGAALAVCALFQYAWRYFQRPEVVAFFDTPRTPPAPPRA